LISTPNKRSCEKKETQTILFPFPHPRLAGFQRYGAVGHFEQRDGDAGAAPGHPGVPRTPVPVPRSWVTASFQAWGTAGKGQAGLNEGKVQSCVRIAWRLRFPPRECQVRTHHPGSCFI